MARNVAAFRQSEKRRAKFAAWEQESTNQAAKRGSAKTGELNEVEIKVIRTPFLNTEIPPSEINWWNAQYEMSKFAQISNTQGTDFENYEGKQVHYLITIDGLFFKPTVEGALKELISAGITVSTRQAHYRISKQTV
jgi:hypothetical protein